MSSTSDLLSLQYDVIPCWYELSFDEKTFAILVKLHKGVLPHLPSAKSSWIAQRFIKEFGFSNFHYDFLDGNFGFEGAFKRVGEEGEYIIFSASIPVLKKIVTKKCSNCYGGGRDLFGTCSLCEGVLIENVMEDCWVCSGKGKNYIDEDCTACKSSGKKIKTITDWHPFHAICATFCQFFSLMYFGQEKGKTTNSNSLQLLLVETSITAEMNGAPLGGVYSIPLVNWLKKFPRDTHFIEVESVMKKAYERIHGRFDDIDKMNTWVIVRTDGFLSISCPGDRTGLFPSSHPPMLPGRGYEFSCHNVDTSAQQLTLLVGLAALCDKARREIR